MCEAVLLGRRFSTHTRTQSAEPTVYIDQRKAVSFRLVIHLKPVDIRGWHQTSFMRDYYGLRLLCRHLLRHITYLYLDEALNLRDVRHHRYTWGKVLFIVPPATAHFKTRGALHPADQQVPMIYN